MLTDLKVTFSLVFLVKPLSLCTKQDLRENFFLKKNLSITEHMSACVICLPDGWLCFHPLSCSVLAKSFFCVACAWYGLHASQSRTSFMCQAESKQRQEGLFKVVCFSSLRAEATWEAGRGPSPSILLGGGGEAVAAVAVVMERIKNVQLKCWPFALSVPLIVKPTCCLFKAVFFCL